jgi:hypothetical protein
MKRRRILLLIGLFFIVLSTHSQTIMEGEFPWLKGQTRVQLIIDWSQLSIANMSVDEWIRCRQDEQPEWNAQNEWESELKPQIGSNIIEQVNRKWEKHNALLTSKPNKAAIYALVVIPQNISRKGDNRNDCLLKEIATDKILVKFTVNSRGGVFGSMSNLWGDGYKNTGKKIATLLARQFR